MEDHSSSSPPSPKSLTTEQGFSDSAGVGESESTQTSSPTTLSPPPLQPSPPTMANPISSSESPFGSNHLPPQENSTMVQELGHQENPTTHRDLPPLNHLPPPNNAPEIQDLGLHEDPTQGSGNPYHAPTSEDLEMIEELSSEQPWQLSLPSSQTITNRVQDLRSGMELSPVLRPLTSNVPCFAPQTQTHRPYGTSGLAPVSITFSNACALGPSAVNIQGDWRLQRQQTQPQQMISTLFRPQRVRDIWVEPEPGVYQLNVAVATQVDVFGNHIYCMGAVLRDHTSSAREAIMRMYQNRSLAEYIIYDAGILMSHVRGYNRLIVETESNYVASIFRNLATDGGFSYFEVRYISRNRNYVAHMFAERALCLNPEQGYLYWNETDIENAFGSRYMPY